MIPALIQTVGSRRYTVVLPPPPPPTPPPTPPPPPPSPPSSIILSDESPYNTPIPAGFTVAANSAPMVTALATPQQFNISAGTDAGNDFQIPVYNGLSTDPLYTISAGTFDTFLSQQINGTQIHIPGRATPAAGSDGHLCVMQPDGWIYDFWQASKPSTTGGTISCSAAGRSRTRGDGFGNQNGVGAKTPVQAGIFDADELNAGVIPHALGIIVPHTDTTGTSWPVPPYGIVSSGGTLRTGMWFKLNYTSAQIAALGLPAWKAAIVTACAVYGVFVNDTGAQAGHWWARAKDDSSTQTVDGTTPLQDFARAHSAQWGSSAPFYADMATGVDWTRFQLVDPAYLQNLYETRVAYKTLNPISDISNNWTLTGAVSASACLTENVYPPFKASTTVHISSSTSGQVSEMLCKTLVPGGRTLTALTCWFYASTGSGVTFRCDLESNATVLASYTMPASQGAAWYAISTGSSDVSGVSLGGIRMKYTILSGGGTAQINAAYVIAEW